MCDILGHWHSASGNPRNQGDTLADFKATLLRLESSDLEGQELRREARRSIQNLAGVSQRLAGHISELKMLNTDIHLQALNAIVRTAALGAEGNTLSVLSAHVDLLCGESKEVVADLVAVLESVVQQTVTIAAGHDPTGEPGRSAGLVAGTESIGTAFEDCRTTFASATTLVANQQAAIQESQPLLSFLAGLNLSLQGQIGELAAFRHKLGDCKSKTAPAAALSETLNQRYTMQSERDIHASAGQSAHPGPQAAAEKKVDPVETLPARAAECPPLPLESLRGNATLPAAAMAAPPRTGSELGDNVDLF